MHLIAYILPVFLFSVFSAKAQTPLWTIPDDCKCEMPTLPSYAPQEMSFEIDTICCRDGFDSVRLSKLIENFRTKYWRYNLTIDQFFIVDFKQARDMYSRDPFRFNKFIEAIPNTRHLYIFNSKIFLDSRSSDALIAGKLQKVFIFNSCFSELFDKFFARTSIDTLHIHRTSSYISLDDDAICGVRSLAPLDSLISSSIGENLQSLRFFSLAECDIFYDYNRNDPFRPRVDQVSLRGLKNLRMLSLAYNNLKSISGEIAFLPESSHLWHLDLSNNKLSYLQLEYIPRSVTHLYLQNNQFTRPSPTISPTRTPSHGNISKKLAKLMDHLVELWICKSHYSQFFKQIGHYPQFMYLVDC